MVRAGLELVTAASLLTYKACLFFLRRSACQYLLFLFPSGHPRCLNDIRQRCRRSDRAPDRNPVSDDSLSTAPAFSVTCIRDIFVPSFNRAFNCETRNFFRLLAERMTNK